MKLKLRSIVIFFLLFFSLSLSALSTPDLLSRKYDRLTIHYSSKHRRFVPEVAEVMKKVVRDLNADLGFSIRPEFEVIIAPSRAEFERYLSSGQSEWALAFAVPPRYDPSGKKLKNGVVVLDPSSLDLFNNSLVGTVKHEVCHIFIGELEGRSNIRIPRWFNEGLAQWISKILIYPDETDLKVAALNKTLIPLEELVDGFPESALRAKLAYLESISLVSYLAEKYGAGSIRMIVIRLKEGVEFQTAVEQTTSVPLAELEKNWQDQFQPGVVNIISIFIRYLNIFVGLAILSVIVFFIVRARSRRRLAEMKEEDAWMESLDRDEWDEPEEK